MRRPNATAAAFLCAILLLLAHPALADPIAREAGRLLGSKAVNTDCADLHVPGCRLWETQWASRYTWSNDHAVEDAALSPDGTTLYLAGAWTPEYGERPDMGLVAADVSTGAPQWAFAWDGPAHRVDRAERVLISPDGATAYLVGAGVSRVDVYESGGWTWIAYTYRGYVHAIDTGQGTRLWTASFGPEDSTMRRHAFLNDAALSPNGELLVVAGRMGSAEGDNQGVVAALHVHNGTESWRHGVAGEGAIDVTDISFDGQGRIVAVANANRTAVVMEVLDAATGHRLHNLTLDAHIDPWSRPELTLDPAGARAVVTVERDDAWRGVLVNLTAPAVEWARDVPDAADRWANPPVAWHPTMDRIAFGGVGGPDHGGLIVVEAATGDTAWTRAGDKGPSYWGLAFSPDGERIVAAGATSARAVALGINGTTGGFEWSTSQRNGSRDAQYDQAMFVDGDVLLAGTTDLSTGDAWLADRVSGAGHVTPDAAQPAVDLVFS